MIQVFRAVRVHHGIRACSFPGSAMTHFSAFSLLKNALNGHKGWREQWPDSQPKA
jgi:hypothetical protein